MKVRLAATLMLASLCAVAVTPAIAGKQSGFVKDLYVRDSDGLIFVDLFGRVDVGDYFPPCTQTHWIIPNETTESGKRLFATLLAALISGHKITIQGKNACTRWPAGGEDIENVVVQ